VNRTAEQTHLYDTPLLLHRNPRKAFSSFFTSSSAAFTDVVFPDVFTVYLTYYYQVQGLSEIFHFTGSMKVSVYYTI